jgi:hypothetical protein
MKPGAAARPARPSCPPKSTSASAPGSRTCGTNPSRPPSCPRSSAAISAPRRSTYLATYEHDARASCSSASRSKTCRAVRRRLRGAARSSRSVASIHPAASCTGAIRTGTLRSGGTGDAIACRAVRRCTTYRAAARHLLPRPICPAPKRLSTITEYSTGRCRTWRRVKDLSL